MSSSYGSGYSQSASGGAGSSTGTSSGQTNAQATNTSFLLESPNSQYGLALAQQAGQLGQNQYNWAAQNYNNLQPTASQAIGGYLQAGQQAHELGTAQQQQYQQMYLPANAQFGQTASTYASAPRVAMNMGAAEAGATQAANQGWANTAAQLQASGVDPSSGISQEARAAANTAAGASAAGAGQQAQQATTAAGRALQAQNVTFGQSEPASALNAINTQFGGYQGAVNTGESNVNTGVNALSSANQFYNSAAANNKLPSVGTQGQSTSGSKQASYSTSSNASSGQSSSGNKSGSYSGYAAGGVVEGGIPDHYAGGGAVQKAKAPKLSVPTAHTKSEGNPQPAHLQKGTQGKPHMQMAHEPKHAPLQEDRSHEWGDPNSQGDDQDQQDQGGGKKGGGHSSKPKSQGPTTEDPNSGNFGTPVGGGAQGVAPGAIPEPAAPQGAGPAATPSAPPAAAPDQGAPAPGFAQGGGIPDVYHTHGLPDAVSGGHIPYKLSPSHGHTTDDVVANLNAGEFVIPRDVTQHYGHKFFYDLINKGRKEGHKMSGENRGMPMGGDSKSSSGQNFGAGGGI